MRRRQFIKLVGGAAAAWPLAARAQPRQQKRRVAVLMGGLFSDDWGGQAEAAALEAGLAELGWKLGNNIELEYRWPGAELDQVSIAANEIVAMRPDLVVSRSTPTTAIMMNRGLPIVFVLVTDPLFSGFVQSLGRPGGNVTGFSVFESSVGVSGWHFIRRLRRRSPECRYYSIPRPRLSRRVIGDQQRRRRQRSA
jgi:putative tryptophan/tyrosine transport system substrate-binding protein